MKSNTVKLPTFLRMLQGIDFPRKLGICARLFGQSLSKKGICWVDTAAGIPWKLDLHNTSHRWIVYGKYEGAAFLNWARQHLPADGVIVDSGANIGQMLLYLAQWIPHGRLLAFEPGAHSADWLAECLSANPRLPVELIRLGLSDTRRTAFLESVGASFGHGSWNQVSESVGEPIRMVRLSDALAERGIRRVDLWKLDVEGSEIPALKGASELLTDKRIRVLRVELHGRNGQAIRDFLDTLGYDCWLFSRSGRLYKPSVLPEHENGMFFPKY